MDDRLCGAEIASAGSLTVQFRREKLWSNRGNAWSSRRCLRQTEQPPYLEYHKCRAERF